MRARVQEATTCVTSLPQSRVFIQEVEHEEVRVVFPGHKSKNFHVRSKHTFGHLLLSTTKCAPPEL